MLPKVFNHESMSIIFPQVPIAVANMASIVPSSSEHFEIEGGCYEY